MADKPVLTIECVHKTEKDDNGYPRKVKVLGMWRRTKKTGEDVPGAYTAGSKGFFEIYDTAAKKKLRCKIVCEDGRTLSADDWWVDGMNWSEKYYAASTPAHTAQETKSLVDVISGGAGGVDDDDSIPF